MCTTAQNCDILARYKVPTIWEQPQESNPSNCVLNCKTLLTDCNSLISNFQLRYKDSLTVYCLFGTRDQSGNPIPNGSSLNSSTRYLSHNRFGTGPSHVCKLIIIRQLYLRLLKQQIQKSKSKKEKVNPNPHAKMIISPKITKAVRNRQLSMQLYLIIQKTGV